VTLVAAGAPVTLDVRDDVAGAGSVIMSLSAPLGVTTVWSTGDRQGVGITSAIHATLAGAGVSANGGSTRASDRRGRGACP
jgi:hypothetical protein